MTFLPRIKGPVPPEQRGETVAAMAERFVGCSLDIRTDELAELVAGGDDDPRLAVQIKTNCATFARGIIEACGVYHVRLDRPYRIGAAVADVLEVARSRGALAPFKGQPLKRGTILHYATPGANNDHVEFLLADAGPANWVAPTCGGGRARNAVTRKPAYDVRRDPRPLQHVIDPVALLGGDDETPTEPQHDPPPRVVEPLGPVITGVAQPYVRGQWVADMQRELGLTADGVLGPRTAQAVLEAACVRARGQR